MFEKEAEEIAKDIYIHHFDDDVKYPDVLKAITVGVQKGAEFGYNKANEKHKQDELGLIISNSSARAELEKQLEQTKILLNAEREVNEKKEYLQYTEYLMDQAKKLKEEKAELIICLQSELDEVIAENIKLKKELYETEGSKGLKG